MIKDLSLKVQPSRLWSSSLSCWHFYSDVSPWVVEVKFVKAFCKTTDAAASSASARFMRLMLCCWILQGAGGQGCLSTLGMRQGAWGFLEKGKLMKVFRSSKHWVPIAGVDGRNGEFKWGFGMCWASSVVKLSMLDVWVWAGNGSSNKYQDIESMERLQSYTVIFLCRWALAEMLFPLFVSNSLMLFPDQIAFSSLSL